MANRTFPSAARKRDRTAAVRSIRHFRGSDRSPFAAVSDGLARHRSARGPKYRASRSRRAELSIPAMPCSRLGREVHGSEPLAGILAFRRISASRIARMVSSPCRASSNNRSRKLVSSMRASSISAFFGTSSSDVRTASSTVAGKVRIRSTALTSAFDFPSASAAALCVQPLPAISCLSPLASSTGVKSTR